MDIIKTSYNKSWGKGALQYKGLIIKQFNNFL